jgi:excisionase family DNA binding protein
VENRSENIVMTTQEACHYLRISRPTYLKYLYLGKIRGAKAGKGWKVLRSELDRFLKGEDEYSLVGDMDLFNRKDPGGEIW